MNLLSRLLRRPDTKRVKAQKIDLSSGIGCILELRDGTEEVVAGLTVTQAKKIRREGASFVMQREGGDRVLIRGYDIKNIRPLPVPPTT